MHADTDITDMHILHNTRNVNVNSIHQHILQTFKQVTLPTVGYEDNNSI